MKETFTDMEIKKLYEGKLLERIDFDFKAQLINENNDAIDEIILQRKYTELFNLMGNYRKM